MKTFKPKARRMWANPVDLRLRNSEVVCTPAQDRREHRVTITPVAVIPLDDVDTLVDKSYEAYCGAGGDGKDGIRAALAAIGALPRARKGRK